MFEELSNLHKKCFPNQPWSADDFRDLKKSGCEIIMSQNGFIVWRNTVDKAEIITIGVNPEMRHQGIASAMVRIIEKDIKNQGVKKIFLKITSTNESTQTLFKNLGYKTVNLQPEKHDKLDIITMKKDL